MKLVDLWLPGLWKTEPDVLREAKCTLEMPPAQCLNSGIFYACDSCRGCCSYSEAVPGIVIFGRPEICRIGLSSRTSHDLMDLCRLSYKNWAQPVLDVFCEG